MVSVCCLGGSGSTADEADGSGRSPSVSLGRVLGIMLMVSAAVPITVSEVAVALGEGS